MLLHIADKSGQSCNGGILLRCARVAAFSFRNESDVGSSFFRHADHGEIAPDPHHGIGINAAALVTDKPGLHASFLQFRDKRRTAGTAPLLGAGRREPYILFGHISFCQKLFSRLKEGHAGAFRVDRSSSVDLSVRDLSAERRLVPSFRRRDYVLMSHENNRLLIRESFVMKQKTSVNLYDLQSLVHQRKQRCQNLVIPEECLPLISEGVRGRIILHHLGKLRGIFLRSGISLQRFIIRFPHRDRQRADQRRYACSQADQNQ